MQIILFSLAAMLFLFAFVLLTPNQAYAETKTVYGDGYTVTYNYSGSSSSQPMYRLYNPNSGEHFYTSDVNERLSLVAVGWDNEGVGWSAPQQGSPVYRLYNAIGGEHHYTFDADEKNMLIAAGWNDEGIGWRSDNDKKVLLYREYNPNAFANNHNYTTSADEHRQLLSIGWRDEGYAWYGVGDSYSKELITSAEEAKKYARAYSTTHGKGDPNCIDFEGMHGNSYFLHGYHYSGVPGTMTATMYWWEKSPSGGIYDWMTGEQVK